ncbi:hypothetical protein GCM10017600_14980 [Streptosporangium carneum]|uniref:RNA polymerase sigma factor 70 region 4 type 2 domain-containing protein n=2 Tax=Streptosporangium carneum TaxID=47481 RepID=A0A9W6HYU7_9ACTN|nr:hypothetical protein GCM10017600_14980 [Streptosporangium carneum]
MRDAFLALADDEPPHVVLFLLRNGIGWQDAHDAAQEAFAEAWRLLDRTPERWQEVADKRAWIRAVALRAARRPPGQARRQPLADATDELPERPVPCGDPAELTVLTMDVLAALRALPPRQRQAMAFHRDGVPHEEIACHLGCTIRQVSNLIRQARAALRVSLADYISREEDRR